ncbi:MAG: hypothetical protein N2450_07730 [bacterium]|nr:hypothetical protein [bacterium]
MKTNECYLFTKKNRVVLNFGRTLSTTTVQLYSVGQLSNFGVPIPLAGTIKKMIAFDGSRTYQVESAKPIQTGDRISVKAVYNAPNYTLVVRVNESDTSVTITGVTPNSDVAVMLLLELIDP